MLSISLYRLRIMLLALLGVAMLSACSSWVFRPNIHQGNQLDEFLVERLRIDMTEEQVRYILGAPAHIAPTAPQQWYYLHSVIQNDGQTQQRKLVVHFKNKQLIGLSGDFEPSINFFIPI